MYVFKKCFNLETRGALGGGGPSPPSLAKDAPPLGQVAGWLPRNSSNFLFFIINKNKDVSHSVRLSYPSMHTLKQYTHTHPPKVFVQTQISTHISSHISTYLNK